MVSDSCKIRFGNIMMEEMELVAQEEIAPRIYSMILKGEMVAQMLPGQFLHIRVPDGAKLLRRPISISEIDPKTQTCRLIYRIEGGGTAIFSRLPIGSKLSVMGPQGNGFDLTNLGQGQKALIIGGGIGVPPLVQVATQLHEQGVEVHSVLGFANKEAVILEEELKQYGQVTITTDDGSYGIQGNVSTVVETLNEDIDAVYSCGAPGMLKYVNAKFHDHPRAYISMESRMACGMGACYACVVHLENASQAANKRVCEDGPVFETGTIVM